MSRVRPGSIPATASRALSSVASGEVSPATAQRVRRAAERLGYVPNTLARGLRTSRSYVAALVVPDITNALFPPIVRGAEQVLTDAGFTLVLTDTNNAAEVERSQIASLRAHGVDGFIMATASWKDPLIDDLAAEDFPTVLVNRRCATSELPFFGGDDQQECDCASSIWPGSAIATSCIWPGRPARPRAANAPTPSEPPWGTTACRCATR